MGRVALRFDWSRVIGPSGDTLYVARVNDLFAFNVYRAGYFWKWVLISTVELSALDKVILAWGDGPTKMEAQLRAEQWADAKAVRPPQQTLFPAATDTEEWEELPF